ncbi:MAG: hypothetical protein ACREC9_02905 [Methylocella sp.]
MNILMLALLGSLRIALFGALKAALFAYILFLTDTAVAGVAPEGNEHKLPALAPSTAAQARIPSNRRSKS